MRRFATLNITVVSILLAVVSIASASPYSDVVSADNPVAYWRLGESSGSTAHDSAGTYSATYAGTVGYGEPGAIAGDPDTAVDLAGGYATTPWAADLNTPVFTVESWVRSDLIDVNWRTPHMTRWVDPATAPSYVCYGHNFYKDRTNHNWEFWIGRGNTSSGFATINGPQVEEGAWTHLVGSYDGTTMRFYVDGASVGSTTVPYGPVPTNMSSLRIGTGAASWIGGLDEMAVYDTALSPERVAIHHAVGRYRPVADVVTFHMDEGTGSTIHDSGHNRATGTLQNGTGWATGKYGEALSFDGDDDYARSTDFPAGQYPELTLEMWLNPGIEAGSQTLFNEQNGDTLWINLLSSNKLAVYLGDTTNRGYHNFNGALPDEQWTHVALTYSDDSDEAKFYLNGLLDNTITTSGVLNFDSSINLGMREDLAGSGYYKGLMDELAIYSYALTPGEILARANAGPPMQTPEPGSIVLLALGLLGFLARRKRR